MPGPTSTLRRTRGAESWNGGGEGVVAFIQVVGFWSGGEEWRWKTLLWDDAPFTIQRGFGRPGVGRYRSRCPAMLDCCTDSTGAGGPARLLHVGWLYCIRGSHRGPGPAVGPTGVVVQTLPKRPGAGSNGGNDLDTEGHRGLLGSVRPLRVSA